MLFVWLLCSLLLLDALKLNRKSARLLRNLQPLELQSSEKMLNPILLPLDLISADGKGSISTEKMRQNSQTSNVLILNADYTPLSILPLSVWSWQDAVRAIFSEKASVVSSYSDKELRGVGWSIELPSVIALNQYHASKRNSIALTRDRVALRDNFQCQYCLQKMSLKELTLDHVHPRSRGGKHRWDNVVSACGPCNYRKASLTLAELSEVDMKLRGQLPRQPDYYQLQALASHHVNRRSLGEGWAEWLPFPDKGS